MTQYLINDQVGDIEAGRLQTLKKHERRMKRVYKLTIVLLMGFFLVLAFLTAFSKIREEKFRAALEGLFDKESSAEKGGEVDKEDETIQILFGLMIMVVWDAVVFFAVIREKYYILLCATCMEVIKLIHIVLILTSAYNSIAHDKTGPFMWCVIAFCGSQGLLLNAMVQLTRLVYISSSSSV